MQEIRKKRVTKNSSKRYSWDIIQQDYDLGLSWRDIIKKYGISSQGIAKAVKRGALKTRDPSEASVLRHKKYGSATMSQEAKKKLSIEQSLNNRGGKCKWFEVDGQKVQGTWERDLARALSVAGITWRKLSIQRDVWPWIDANGRDRSYTPDFYLPTYDVYLEVKGYWWGDDKHKHQAVTKQHSDKCLILVQKDLFYKLCKFPLEVLNNIMTR